MGLFATTGPQPVSPPARKPSRTRSPGRGSRSPDTASGKNHGNGASGRERLLRGMTRAVARHGYVEASIVQAVEYGGVARATFYEHFADKEECFRAAFRDIAGRTMVALQAESERAIEASRAAPTDDLGGLQAVLALLLKGVEHDPDGARLMLIESLAADPPVRVERMRLVLEMEQTVERLLRERPDGAPALDITAEALIGGVLGVISMRVLRGEIGGLTHLLDDLLAWIRSYALPAGAAPHDGAAWLALGSALTAEPAAKDRSGGAPEPPRSRKRLPESLARREYRERIVKALARTARAKGFAAMTVADVVTAARISRNVFYEHFGSKQEAFTAAQTVGIQDIMRATAAGFASGTTWPERVWKGELAFLDYFVSQPELIYLEFVEIYAAGPLAIQRHHDAQIAFTVFLEEGYRQDPECDRLPRLASEAISGAIGELSHRQVYDGRSAQARELLPEIAYLALAPFIGPVAAATFVKSEAKQAVRGRRSTA
jgi:AcrR family transcriptional regulator